MIQSKITVGDKVITADQFPEAAALTKVSEDGIRTTYYDNEYISNLLTENRVGRFLLLSQRAQSFADCQLEIKRTGVPVLMMTLAKNSDMVRTRRGKDRHWCTGDVCLSLFPEEDTVVNHCRAGGIFELFNIVLTEPVVQQLAERHPEALNTFCQDFERNESIAYTSPGTQASRKLLHLFQEIEQCNEMGNYAEKYLETQILDCLSMMINRVNESDETFSPVNLVLSDKVHEAREIMTTQYQNPPSLHQLATMVGTNECTLKSAFKQEFGETVFQCLFDHRMSLAVNYLKETSWPIAEIGLLLGYEYQSHFCTAFRRKYGMSPTDFREKCGNSVR